MPKLFPWAEYPFPLNRFARSRLWLAPPYSHMPPHGWVLFPFRTAMLSLTVWPEPPPTKMPDMQLFAVVTPITVTPLDS